MRILLYNFIQPEEPKAGGVGIYLENLTKALIGNGHQVITMSSGDRYSLIRRSPRVEFSRDRHDRAVVINSPVFAPAVYTFGASDSYTESDGLDFLPEALAKRYGAIDVFHFQNIEGLTTSFFHKLRTTFPDARIIYSVHNYHLMCAKVNLWHQNRVSCEDYREGVACTMCGASVFDLGIMRRERRLLGARKAYPRAVRLAAPALKLLRRGWRLMQRARVRNAVGGRDRSVSTPTPSSAQAYAKFRRSNIVLCRDVFDHVLAVSERTRQVIVGLGVPADKVSVSYIGTAHKAAYLSSTKIEDIGAGLHLGFIGYMAIDKGFRFLVECLERIPDAVAADITVTVAARNTDPEGHARLQRQAARYRKLRYFDGYTHDNLDAVLAGVNLGLVPVLWEDNLPQTAIELVSRGIPILTSDRGGAQEIAHDARFVFRAGRHDDFVDSICRTARRELSLGDFWTNDMRILSMTEHVADLMHYYAPAAAA